ESGALALVDEQRGLRLAHGELAALLDLGVAHRETPREDLVAILRPLDDVDELLLEEVEKAHVGLQWSALTSRSAASLTHAGRRNLEERGRANRTPTKTRGWA